MARMDDYNSAAELARQQIREVNPKQLTAKCGGEFIEEGKGAVLLPFIGRQVLIRFDKLDLEYRESTESQEVPIQEQVLILHYLVGCSGGRPTGKLITYREIPSGEFYYPAFKKRAIDPLVRTFGANPDLFIKAARALGGIPRSDLSGLAFLFLPFPLIPLLLQLHEADEEFPAEGNVLFDEIVGEYLSLEDAAWLGGMVVYRLMGLSRSLTE